LSRELGYRNPDGPAVERQWIFKIRDAEFRLIPRRTGAQDEATFTEERLAFAGQPDPDRTIEGTLQRIFTLGLQSLQSEGLTTTYKSASTITFNPHNTRFRTPLEPEEDDVIRCTKLRPLGRGGQGEVHKIVDMYTGAHHACKIIAVKAEVPQWKIYSERGFRERVETEVNLVQNLKHVSSPILDRLPHANHIKLTSCHIPIPRDSRSDRTLRSLCPFMKVTSTICCSGSDMKRQRRCDP
jgi:hypothetical protein